jgi:phosphopantothenate---cysteine ligase (ATP)
MVATEQHHSDIAQLNLPTDYTTFLSPQCVNDLRQRLKQFIADQQSTFVRPICLVSSGGTAVDLEVNAVRCLDNFSTGLRGAISVEEFLKRGYAVIHLQREGSASPYARILNHHLGLKQSNHSLTTECLGKLFVTTGESDEDDLLQSVLDEEKDPWMTKSDGATKLNAPDSDSNDIRLHRAVLNSSTLRKALKERADALNEGRLITIYFRTVEEYLSKLQICAESIAITKSLAMFYLAAAVSDFYIPIEDKSIHKIQSSGSDDDSLTLHLKPVPKVMGSLRRQWAPNAFLVSFKLETDIEILRRKSIRAVEKYGCHVVIGNILQTRHDKVWLLAPTNFEIADNASNVENWPMTELTKDRSSNSNLESSIVDIIVQSHFEFMSYHYTSNEYVLKQIASANNDRIMEKKAEQRKIIWKKVKGVGLEVIGAALTLWISYSINTAFQRRHQRLLVER